MTTQPIKESISVNCTEKLVKGFSKYEFERSMKTYGYELYTIDNVVGRVQTMEDEDYIKYSKLGTSNICIMLEKQQYQISLNVKYNGSSTTLKDLTIDPRISINGISIPLNDLICLNYRVVNEYRYGCEATYRLKDDIELGTSGTHKNTIFLDDMDYNCIQLCLDNNYYIKIEVAIM